MCYPVCGGSDPLLLIRKSSPCNGGSKFSLSLSDWFFTLCMMPYNHKCVECIVKWNISFLLSVWPYHATHLWTPTSFCCVSQFTHLCWNNVKFIYGVLCYRLPLSSTKLSLVPASAPWLVQQRLWYVLSCPLLLIRKSRLCGGNWFLFSLSKWSFTICLMQYNHK